MKLNATVLRRIFWPERASLFVLIGGAAGMAGDMTSFFTDIISPAALTGLFGVVAAVCVLLCLQRALLVDESKPEEVKAVIKCGVCDAMRFSLFAAAAFTLLLIIGQGRSATENVAEMLGLMQKDVSQIAADVSELSDIADSQKIIANPKVPEDFFRNAWIHANIQRNSPAAFASLEEMYKKFAPRKMDGAELFYNTGRQVKTRNELMIQMEAMAHDQKDVTLLVIASRNADTPEESLRLALAAREMDPEYPFAYWDIMNSSAAIARASIAAEDQRASIQQQVTDMEKFLSLMSDKPASYFFFLPQYQGDFDMMVRQTLGSMRMALRSYEQADEMRKNLPQAAE
ncbi:MAG: hypothetical protein KJ667_09095 [Alphaproteobacteria bacterium]|nr:hypothetical protein [Alphaproteobacteria bacterium]